jgi:hypothetical protein
MLSAFLLLLLLRKCYFFISDHGGNQPTAKWKDDLLHKMFKNKTNKRRQKYNSPVYRKGFAPLFLSVGKGMGEGETGGRLDAGRHQTFTP